MAAGILPAGEPVLPARRECGDVRQSSGLFSAARQAMQVDLGDWKPPALSGRDA
jgi:hypothetical protein